MPVLAQEGNDGDGLGLACEVGSAQARKGHGSGRVRLQRLQQGMVVCAGIYARGDSWGSNDGMATAAADGL